MFIKVLFPAPVNNQDKTTAQQAVTTLYSPDGPIIAVSSPGTNLPLIDFKIDFVPNMNDFTG